METAKKLIETTCMIVGGAVVVITIVVDGCRITGCKLVMPAVGVSGADDVTAAATALMGEGTGVALARR
jgi:hypothetical protein